MKVLVILLLAGVSLAAHPDGRTKEAITMRVKNPDFSTTKTHMLKMLQKADLEGHGFLKEESSTVSNNSAYTASLYYYKMVNCSQVQMMKVVMEVEELLPGVLGASVDARVANEITKTQNIDTTGQCKVGVEIHFIPIQSHVSKSIFGRTLGQFKRGRGAQMQMQMPGGRVREHNCVAHCCCSICVPCN